MLLTDIPFPIDAFLPAVVAEGPDMTRYLFACLVVLGLLSLGAFVLARLNRTALVQRAKKRSLRVLDVLPIGRKQRLCVVRAYDRTFVLGVGEREVTLVAELDQDDDLAAQALAEADGAQVAAVKPGSFAALLRGITGASQGTLLAQQASAPVASNPTPATSTPTAAAVEADVERRAALAARDALLSILDERRAEAAARRAQKASTGEPRKKVARPVAEAREAAPAAKPERRAEARPRPAAAPVAGQATTNAPAPGASRASASWVG